MRAHAFIFILFFSSAKQIFASDNDVMNEGDDDDVIMLPNSSLLANDVVPSVSVTTPVSSSSTATANALLRPSSNTNTAFINLSQQQQPRDSRKKPKKIKAVKPAEISVANVAQNEEADQAIKRPRKNAAVIPKNKAELLPPSRVTLMAPSMASYSTTSAASTKGTKTVSLEFMNSILLALESRTFAPKNIYKIKGIGFESFSVEQGHTLLLKSIAQNKESAAVAFLKGGWKLKTDPLEMEVSATVYQSLDKGKYDFMAYMLDFDPVGASKIFVSMNSNGLKHLTSILKKHGSRIDPEAIRLAAETAAEAKNIAVFKAFLDSGLMLRMVSRKSLVNLLSSPILPESRQITMDVLDFILKDRKLANPFEPHLLTQAINDNCTEFFEIVLTFPGLFSWDIIIRTFCETLRKNNFTVAAALLGPILEYKNPDRVFLLVPEAEFLATVASHANSDIISKLPTVVLYNGTSMLVPDLSLMKIYYNAAKLGNVSVVLTLLQSGYFSINQSFRGKSIVRVALEKGQFSLVKELIRLGFYQVGSLTDSPTVNPKGDALLYVADESHIEMFEYLLAVGADPDVRVNHEGAIASLFNWCLYHRKFKLCDLLISHGHNFSEEVSRPFAQSREAIQYLVSKRPNTSTDINTNTTTDIN